MSCFQPSFRLALCIMVAALIGGCALTTDQIKLEYVPMSSGRLEGAETVKVKTEVIDLRTVKDKVSSKKNGYGMEMAPIVTVNDVSELVSTSLNTELANRGFTVSGGSLLVRSELSRFYSDFKIGFWAGDAVADVIMNVQVKRPDDKIIFSKTITGQYVNPSIQLASGENARIALNGALKDAVQKLVNDPEFINCLLDSGRL